MSKICISAETTIDMPKELLEKHDIHTVPFGISVGEEQWLDGEIDNAILFAKIKEANKLPRTHAVNEFQYEEYFSELLKTYDVIIHFSLSKEISSAYSNALKVSEQYKRVYIVNTQSLSTGIALLALNACKMRDEGKEALEIVQTSLRRIPKVQASFVAEKVDYLYKGGRCSVLAYIGANLLGLKPEIVVRDGKLVPGHTYRGKFHRAILKYVDVILEDFNDPDLENVFITYTSAPEELVAAVRAKLQERGFKNIYETVAGCTIASHCGPHTLGILYINDGTRQ